MLDAVFESRSSVLIPSNVIESSLYQKTGLTNLFHIRHLCVHKCTKILQHYFTKQCRDAILLCLVNTFLCNVAMHPAFQSIEFGLVLNKHTLKSKANIRWQKIIFNTFQFDLEFLADFEIDVAAYNAFIGDIHRLLISPDIFI